MRRILILVFIGICCLNTVTLGNLKNSNIISFEQVSYAYIRVEGKFLSKKLKVKVDLGDTEKQIEDGERLSDILSNKKSYASVLNYMSELGYELVNTLDLTSNYNGSGGTSGIVYVMKRKD